MAKIVTLGELMLRLSTQDHKRFVQAKEFDVVFGGGEANVCASLALWGHDAYFVSKLPKHEIGQAAIHFLSAHQIKTDYIARGGERIGIYFLETGVSMRPSKVIYDRSQSAMALADPKDFDFQSFFKGATWFHWSGITPALSKSAEKIIEIACQKAKEAGLMISVDLNYRKKLWTKEDAQRVMKPLMKYVDVCIGNEEDAELVLGYKPKHVDIKQGKLDVDAYKQLFIEMKEIFGFKMIASTLRESYSASKNGWSALLYDGKEFYESKHYLIEPIVDRVGGGDSFAAGLIHGLIQRSPKEAIEYAVAASALKHTIPGDFNLVTEDEVDRLVQGDQSGRVQR